MHEALYAASFWLTVPALGLARTGRRRAALALLAAAPILAAFGGTGAAKAASVAATAALAFALARRSVHTAVREAGVRIRTLRRQARATRIRVNDLAREAGARLTALERLQSRFALVQGMATRLDTNVLLQSLGALWSEVPGVRRVLLLQRRPNGNWAVAFSRGLATAEAWVHLLEAHPELTEGKRLRKHSSLDRVPFLKDQGLEPPFFLVPVAWGDDVMALGYVEVSQGLFEEGDAGFDTERKLVSIGLRRAFLYDLMTERSRHDGLTGALLRRTFMERLQESVRNSLRYKTPLFAALFDVDHFKAVNDTHGHQAGDRALMLVSRLARDLATPGVTVGRVGGDEFAVILEAPALDEALKWMELLRSRVEAEVLREGEKEIRLTISAGVSAFFPERLPAEALLAAADEALYRAKRGGRNRVCAHAPAAPAGGGD